MEVFAFTAMSKYPLMSPKNGQEEYGQDKAVASTKTRVKATVNQEIVEVFYNAMEQEEVHRQLWWK